MPEALKAIDHNGAFIEKILIYDSAEKQRFLKSLVERMQQNPIPFNAPRFTREMLHERR